MPALIIQQARFKLRLVAVTGVFQLFASSIDPDDPSG